MGKDAPLTCSTSTILITNKKDDDTPDTLLEFFENTEEDDTESTMSKFWSRYRGFVQRYRIPLELADEAVDRILFWMPHHENNSTQWREVLYGFLSLHRLAMHCSQEELIKNCFGTSVQTQESPEIAATSVRISLSIIHCLMPSLLEIIPKDSLQTRRQTSLRKRLEQIKFALRLYLLVSYWKQFLKSEKYTIQSGSFCRPLLDIGILKGGGMFHLDQGPGLSIQEADHINRRMSFVGRRTGLTITSSTSHHKPVLRQKRQLINSILGELLNILRPLYWASAEARNHSAMHDDSSRSLPLLKSLLVTLVMDITSLRLLMNQRFSGNKCAVEEWNRRKNRLLLYLVRAPVWQRLTSPALERSSAALQKIPVLGQLIDVCLWDWILYWKLPYVSEEG